MDRPFLTFEQQLNRLKSHYGLIVNDNEFAINVLSTISYYDLINGYQSLYVKNGKFESNMTMEYLVGMHVFNKHIQSVIFKYSLYAENSFKTILAYVIAEHFGVHTDDYLKVSNYKDPKNSFSREGLKRNLTDLLKTSEKCEYTPTKHYRETKNHIPPWILFRNISFSDASNIFKHLNSKEKEIVFSHYNHLNNQKNDFGETVRIIQTSLKVVRKFRNQIAHNLNFMNYREITLRSATNNIFLGTLIEPREVKHARNDVWALIMALILLLNNDYLIYIFLVELLAYMNTSPDFIEDYCNHTGIPKDFEKRITSYLSLPQFTKFQY